jgi:DNA-binding protein
MEKYVQNELSYSLDFIISRSTNFLSDQREMNIPRGKKMSTIQHDKISIGKKPLSVYVNSVLHRLEHRPSVTISGRGPNLVKAFEVSDIIIYDMAGYSRDVKVSGFTLPKVEIVIKASAGIPKEDNAIKKFLEVQDKLLKNNRSKQMLDISYEALENPVLKKYNVKDIDELFNSVVERGMLSHKSYSDPEFKAIMRLQEYRGKDLTDKDFDEFDIMLANQPSS